MLKKLTFIALLAIPIISHAVQFDTWETNEGISANYILNIDEQSTDGVFDFNLTIDPWNAEALGLFIDLGDKDLISGSLVLSAVVPADEVVIFATDTNSNSCGSACILNGLDTVLLDPDSEWELVFRLADQGYEGIQTFSFTLSGLVGIDESDIGLIGVRSQVLCSGDDLLPDDSGSCGGSDKSYYNVPPVDDPPPPPVDDPTVPEPTSLMLMALGLLGFFGASRKKA